MKAEDQPTSSRRALLRLAACVGAAATVHVLSTDTAQTPDAPTAAKPGPAAGPPRAGAPLKASAYRLRPMTAYGPPKLRPAVPPVRRKPFLRMDAPGRTMVLTFDDGPDPRYTPALLKTLRRHGARAMFFVCGEMAAENQDLLREMTDDGHVIGNHSWSHPLIPKLSRSRIRSQLGRTSDVVERTVGAAPRWYRAPYGAWNRASFEIGAELGMEPLGWTLDTLDWTEPGSSAIVRRVRAGAGPGVVVLSHDAGGDRSGTVRALRTYLPELLDQGYRITVPQD
ncbi:polysaccharide deacetylase family protein [Streptomyces candidus]|uniref:Peptidoglycan/xylan/chitin deacetylase (PgdA/CDA1 family) n=1 Tax=Streptomyces candidus TaxID=67283 RepID=A0A7X0HLS4_9ACTN|nr:polysaccharide deacetylase family protein [Streptomyces candidus]MBB6438727.1 peptidoglycan/xylan/chitin deacetylase (PgdA/CDA1 family) [Streptomyces candidus]